MINFKILLTVVAVVGVFFPCHSLALFTSTDLRKAQLKEASSAPGSYSIKNLQWSNCIDKNWPLTITGYSTTFLEGNVLSITVHAHTSVPVISLIGHENGTFSALRVNHAAPLDQLLLPPYKLPFAAGADFIFGNLESWFIGVGRYDGSSDVFNERGTQIGCMLASFDIVDASTGTDTEAGAISGLFNRIHKHQNQPSLSSTIAAAQYAISDLKFNNCAGAVGLILTNASYYITGGDALALFYEFSSAITVQSLIVYNAYLVKEHEIFIGAGIDRYLLPPLTFPITPQKHIVFALQVAVEQFGVGDISFTGHFWNEMAANVACFDISYKVSEIKVGYPDIIEK